MITDKNHEDNHGVFMINPYHVIWLAGGRPPLREEKCVPHKVQKAFCYSTEQYM